MVQHHVDGISKFFQVRRRTEWLDYAHSLQYQGAPITVYARSEKDLDGKVRTCCRCHCCLIMQAIMALVAKSSGANYSVQKEKV